MRPATALPFGSIILGLCLAGVALSGHSALTDTCIGPAVRRLTYGIMPSEAPVYRATGDFFKLKTLDPATTAKLNEKTLQALRNEALPVTSRKAALSEREMHELFGNISKNPQVTESLCGTYKGSSEAGFCWGRAMAAHLKALQSGVSNQSVRKLWAVGSLKTSEAHWKYHVTTIVRGRNGDWYALDPLFEGPVPLEEWVSQMKEFDPSGTMRLFATPAERFGPAHRGKYRKDLLVDEFYHGFFVDLLDIISRENSGKPGYWAKYQDKQAQLKAMKELTKRLGVGGLSAAGGLVLQKELEKVQLEN